MKGKIDKFLGYFISKKLSVFIVASFFVGFGMIESTEWVNVSLIYIGGQSVIDAVAKLRK
jgi:membrane-associated protease RseP (regulator of RpoE activity)